LRDLLPPEALGRRKLTRRLLDHFGLHGYALVTPPAFELADVLERGLGTLDPRDVLRFVEPESGAVAALRPDVTPQIARVAATRLADRPMPMRLCYEGTVLRRRQERARRHRQIPQAGVELLGVRGPDGDVEIMSLAVSSAQAAGLADFKLDLGHADIARAMISEFPAALASTILDALARKDTGILAELARGSGTSASLVEALCELPKLHGDGAVWKDAQRLLAPTPAAPALTALRNLWDRARASGLESVLLVDFGEVRGFAYYTGTIFHLLAEGPGEPIGSGGRYDDLLARFGAPMPAAGFALDLDNLSWALKSHGREEKPDPKIVVALGGRGAEVCAALRARSVGCVMMAEGDPEGFAKAWGFSHVLRASGSADQLVLWDAATAGTTTVTAGSSDDVAARLAEKLGSR
jgi:ATP phosphoribosyltransferase regulatory subunit